MNLKNSMTNLSLIRLSSEVRNMLVGKNKIYIFLVFITFLAFVSSGFLNFEPWGQVLDYRSQYESMGGFFWSPHIFRYSIVHPVYVGNELTGINIKILYSIYLFSISFLISILWLKTKSIYYRRSVSGFICIVVPFLLLFFVNGRFIFCLFGLALILYAVVCVECDRLTIFRLIVTMLGLVFSSASSGVFLVGVIFLVSSFLSIYRRRPASVGLAMRFFLILPLSLILFLSSVFVLKNYEYFFVYGDGIHDALSHGVGFLFQPVQQHELCSTGDVGVRCLISDLRVNYIRFIFLSAIVTFSCLFAFIVYSLKVLSPIAGRGLIVSVLGGIFGFTTLMSFLFVIPVLLSRRRVKASKLE